MELANWKISFYRRKNRRKSS